MGFFISSGIKRQVKYRLVIIFSTIIVWIFLILAGYASYDVNYLLLLCAFLWSFVVLIYGIIGLISRGRHWTKNLIDFVLFLILGSPFTVIVVFWNYPDIFGKLLAV